MSPHRDLIGETRKARYIKVCKMVAEDMERDVKEADGKPLTAALFADIMGKQNAAIAALASIIAQLVDDIL